MGSPPLYSDQQRGEEEISLRELGIDLLPWGTGKKAFKQFKVQLDHK